MRSKTHSIQIVIRDPNQRIQMIRKTQRLPERSPRIRQLTRRGILYVEQRVQRVLDGNHIVRRHHDSWDGDRHVCIIWSVTLPKSPQRQQHTSCPNQTIPLRPIHKRRTPIRNRVIIVPRNIHRVRNGRVDRTKMYQRITIFRVNRTDLIRVCASIPYAIQQFVCILINILPKKPSLHDLPSQWKYPE
jgi:hypothetical protein